MPGKTGRRRLPTATKRLRGEKRAERLNPREPELPVGTPGRPTFLDPEAVAEWDAMVPKLLEAKVLTQLDGSALAAYCELHSDRVRIGKEIAGASGSDLDRLMARRRNTLLAIRLYLLEFGMTPSARAKVKTVEEKKDDPVEEWQKLKKAHMVRGGKS